LVALLSGGVTLGAYKLFFEEPTTTRQGGITTLDPIPTANFQHVGLTAEARDFTQAAEIAVNSVVHVKNVSYRQVNDPIMEVFFRYRGGGQPQNQIGTCSGGIISEDGYIVTNNHVINNASEIEITINNKKAYKAKLIGTESQMDIALLKIDANEKLP